MRIPNVDAEVTKVIKLIHARLLIIDREYILNAEVTTEEWEVNINAEYSFLTEVLKKSLLSMGVK